MIPKGTTHEFWKSIHAGAVKASREQGAYVIWKGPVREDDRDEQIKVMETFISQNVDGIVIAPLDSKALVPVLNDARARKIPVAIIDSGVEWDGAVTFIATDNEKAGGLAAERLGNVLGGRGRVIDDAAPGGVGKYHGARDRLPRDAGGEVPSDQGRVVESVRGRDDRDRVCDGRAPARNPS